MSLSQWKIPKGAQPKPEDCAFDLDAALGAVMTLSASVPKDAFTADTLGTERAGNAVLIGRDGVVATIGYLVMEAEAVWLTMNDGRVMQGDVIAIDAESGIGLVQLLGRVDVPPLPLGSSARATVGDRVVVAGAGGRQRSVSARIVAKQEFAGYWEYLLDEAIFTSPAHPHWGGTALIGGTGELLGIGSLQLQQDRDRDQNLNMIVPVDLLSKALGGLLSGASLKEPARPWLGLYATEVDGNVVVAGLADGGPADKAGLQVGDVLVSAAGSAVANLAGLYRGVWSLGHAGVPVPLRLNRSGQGMEVTVVSTDRARLLKKRALH